MHRHEGEISAGTMRQPKTMPRTFDELSISDLESVYEEGREEVLRDHAFRILLSLATTASRNWRGWPFKGNADRPERDPDLGARRPL